jgi:hypothetical protein
MELFIKRADVIPLLVPHGIYPASGVIKVLRVVNRQLMLDKFEVIITNGLWTKKSRRWSL